MSCEEKSKRDLKTELGQVLSESELCSACKAGVIEEFLPDLYLQMAKRHGFETTLQNIGVMVMSFAVDLEKKFVEEAQSDG